MVVTSDIMLMANKKSGPKDRKVQNEIRSQTKEGSTTTELAIRSGGEPGWTTCRALRTATPTGLGAMVPVFNSSPLLAEAANSSQNHMPGVWKTALGGYRDCTTA